FFYARCARNQVDRRLDASSAHGRERNACGMRWRQSRARLSREKLLHLVESFLKSTHVILRKNEGKGRAFRHMQRRSRKPAEKPVGASCVLRRCQKRLL